jgi:hypothetical protein
LNKGVIERQVVQTISDTPEEIEMKAKLFAIALAAALGVSFAAVAAEEKPAQTTKEQAFHSEKAKPAKKKVKRHDHNAEHKQGVAAPEKKEAAGEPAKPLHDHQKEHK